MAKQFQQMSLFEGVEGSGECFVCEGHFEAKGHQHHVHGRRYSTETILLCEKCHVIYHKCYGDTEEDFLEFKERFRQLLEEGDDYTAEEAVLQSLKKIMR